MSETEKDGGTTATNTEAGNAASQTTAAQTAAPESGGEEMSFAEMFELAEKQAKSRKKDAHDSHGTELHPGQVLNARIVGFSHDSVFLDVGAKAEGVIAKSELLDDAGQLTVKEGDKIEVRVRKIEGGTVVLTRVLGHQSLKNREVVKEAQKNGIPIEGKVTAQNKGGYDVDLGGLRAFCPASQIDVRQGAPSDAYVGQKFPFKVIEYKDGGRNIVVSRRAILQEEKKKKSDEVLATLAPGQTVKGVVTSLKDYGAFVDLGGVEGLVHVSEISHGHISRASDALKMGQEVEALVLKIENAKETKEGREPQKKISLSMKALSADPWDTAKATIKEGAKVKGKVLRIQQFGAFVEVLPGVDALIHVSNMSDRRISNPAEVVKVGDEVEATIVAVDWDKKRIGLSLVKTPQELANDLAAGTVHEGTIDRIESFGLFVKLPTGARGLVPAAETGTQRGADLKKEFKQGSKVKVSVLEVDANSGKIRLSIRQVAEAEERAEYQGYMKGSAPAQTSGGSGLGTLGDLFKGKFQNAKRQ
ncbi:S1 RNA-binding domain-containing protein [Myxococcota bacterium]|nr:S1 RNA-binding domain-containing protein [Myxococcota bacterium]